MSEPMSASDRKASRPTQILLTIDLPSGATEDRAKTLHHDLVWLLRGHEGFRALDYQADVWREVDAAEGDEVPCNALNDLNIGPLDSGKEWRCIRLAGHDEPELDGGHLFNWALPATASR